MKTKIWRTAVFSLFALLGVAAVFFAASSKRRSTSTQYRLAPSFELKDPQDRHFQSTELKGHLSIVHFWASWCAPCLEELPQFVQLSQEYSDKPIRFVAITLDSSWSEAHSVLGKIRLGPSFISLIDPEVKVSEAFGTFNYPESYLISPDLRILLKWVGPQKWLDPQMKALLDQLLESMKSKSSDSPNSH